MPRVHIAFSTALALVLANTIGTGVFTTSGFALADLGSRSAVLLAWALGGVHALLGALAYADLAARYPHSGGEYVYVSETLHPALGRTAGWISLVAGFTSPIAGAALAAQLYVERSLGWTHAAPWLASGLVLFLTLLHARFARFSLRIQDVAVYAKAAAIGVFALAGFAMLARHGTPSTSEASRLSASTLFGSFVWISYAYSGWNAAVYVASEVVDARATLRRALVLGTLTITLLYLAVNAVILYAVPSSALVGQADAGAMAAATLAGPRGGAALTWLIAFALVSCASSMLLTGPRVYARMAADGALPSWFADGHDVHQRALWLQAALALVVIWVGSIESVLSFVSFLLGLGCAAAVLGHMRLLWQERSERWSWRMLRDGTFVIVTVAISVAAASLHPYESAATLAMAITTTWWSARALKAKSASPTTQA